MAIRQRKDGRIFVYYTLNGKRKEEYFGRGVDAQRLAEDRDAELKATGVIRGYKKDPTPVHQGITFGELAAEYIKIEGLTSLEESSKKNLYYSLTGTILPEIGHLQAAGLTHKRLDAYVEKRLSTQKTVMRGRGKNKKATPLFLPDGKTPKLISRSSVNRELCDIQAIMNWAVKKKYLLTNPVLGHKKPKKDDQRNKPPTSGEVRNILAHSAPHLIRALKISYFTGLRPGAQELFRITWDDVDFEQKTIHILSAKKKGIPYRDVPLHIDLEKDLVRWRQEDQDKPATEIITYKGRPISSVKTAYRAAKRRAGVTRRIRMYDFRHAAISFMLAEGGDLKSVSQIAGHSRTDTTTRIYQHTSIEQLRDQINRIPSLDEEPDPGGNLIEMEAAAQKLESRQATKATKK